MSEKAKRAAAIGLALSMLSVPTVSAQESQDSQASVEVDRLKYDLPLTIISEMMDMNSSGMADIFEKISKNPENYIEIEHESGFFEEAAPGVRYSIYSDMQKEDEPVSQWSMQIFVGTWNNEPNSATLFLQLNPRLEIYRAGIDALPQLGSISEEMLEQASDKLFNTPSQMKNSQWVPDYNKTYSAPNYMREFTDWQTFYFSQSVGPDNIVSFYSIYPIPDISEAGVQNVPEQITNNAS